MLKKAKSMKTGRTAMLPPAIYNNPTRMTSGGWVFVEEPPVAAPVAVTAPITPMFDTLTTDTEDNVAASTEETKKSRKQKPQTNE